MANYFVPLQAPRPRNAMLDLSPINQGLDSIGQANQQTKRNAMLQQSQDLQQRTFDANQAQLARQNQRQDREMYGKQAYAVDQEQDPQRRAALWRRITAGFDQSTLSPEELDPITGPKLMMAQAGLVVDPLDRQIKQAQLAQHRAQTAALSQRADQSKVMEVNGVLVRVPVNGPAEEIYRSSTAGQRPPPAGYEPDPSRPGALRAIPGGPGDPANKPLTEGQTKDASLAERLIRSERSIASVAPIDAQGRPIGDFNPAAKGKAWWYDNSIVNSAEWKTYFRAVREGLAAILRKDSGGAVTQAEFDLYYPTFYPQPGDPPQTVADKQAARMRQAEGMRRGSGPAYERMFGGQPNSGLPEGWKIEKSD